MTTAGAFRPPALAAALAVALLMTASCALPHPGGSGPAGQTVEIGENVKTGTQVKVMPGTRIHVSLPRGKTYGPLTVATDSYDGHVVLRPVLQSGSQPEGTYLAVAAGQSGISSVVANPQQRVDDRGHVLSAWSIQVCVAGAYAIHDSTSQSPTSPSLTRDCSKGSTALYGVGYSPDNGQHWIDSTPAVAGDTSSRADWELRTAPGADWLLYLGTPGSGGGHTIGTFVSTDGGRTWQARASFLVPGNLFGPAATAPGSYAFRDVVAADGLHLWLLLHDVALRPKAAAVVRTADGARTWAVTLLPAQPCLPSHLTVVDAANVWGTGACYEQPPLMVSHDGGRTWAPVPLTTPADQPAALAGKPCTCQIEDLTFTDAQHGSLRLVRSVQWPVAANRVVYMETWAYTTVDGGATWAPGPLEEQ